MLKAVLATNFIILYPERKAEHDFIIRTLDLWEIP